MVSVTPMPNGIADWQATCRSLSSRKTDDGQPVDYLAFVRCESEELIRGIYPGSGTGIFCFEKPEPNTQPSV